VIGLKVLFIVAITSLVSCVGMPEKVTPISGFQSERYLGTWYEIARLDHSFEKGMERVSANYSLKDDGGIVVENKGFLPSKKKWKKARGKAYFVGDETVGHLKVSFFGPFYGSYVVFELDEENYQYAFVSGPNLSYLWFLSRTPQVSPGLKELFLARAKEVGFDTEEIIFVKQLTPIN
jgi:apolipoprotein D and lipocalin family protein